MYVKIKTAKEIKHNKIELVQLHENTLIQLGDMQLELLNQTCPPSSTNVVAM